MRANFTQRKANINDIKAIVALLVEDELGASRDHLSDTLDPKLRILAKLNADSCLT